MGQKDWYGSLDPFNTDICTMAKPIPKIALPKQKKRSIISPLKISPVSMT